MNKVQLIGRLTREPNLRKTGLGKSVANFTLAVTRDKENADFINCVVWEKQADNLVKYCPKGSLIGVVGRIQTRTWDDDHGKRQYVTEVLCESIEFLQTKPQEQPQEQPKPQQTQKQENDPFYGFVSNPPLDISSDDLPF